MSTAIHNSDMNVPKDLLEQLPQLTGVLDNSYIDEVFKGPEAVAKKSKAFFNVFGLSSLIFIILVLLITTWRFFLHEVDIAPPVYLLWISAGLGFFSFAMSLSSHFVFGFRHKWFDNRFITERLRQWKFQQLLDGEFVLLSKSNSSEFEKERTARWAKAKFDVLEKPGTMNDFLNSETFELFVKPSVCPDKQVGKQIVEAYKYLRLDYQAKYFSLKRDMLRSLDVWTNSIAKISLLIAGFLALAEVLVLLVQNVEQESTLSWIMGASALSAALISAGIRVVRSAKAISEETERYASKWVLLKILTERFRTETDPARQLECMIETERVCIEELREFIRTFHKSDYLL
jgi:uncharacterized integral membrane protein